MSQQRSEQLQARHQDNESEGPQKKSLDDSDSDQYMSLI